MNLRAQLLLTVYLHFISDKHQLISSLLLGSEGQVELGGPVAQTSAPLAHAPVSQQYLACDWLRRPRASEVSFLDLSKNSGKFSGGHELTHSQVSGGNGTKKAVRTR